MLYIPQRILPNNYHIFTAPYMNYGICAWGSCAQVYQKRILVLRKNAFRFIFGNAPEHTFPFFVQAKCLLTH